jgi:YVTN family beta-propeller protein
MRVLHCQQSRLLHCVLIIVLLLSSLSSPQPTQAAASVLTTIYGLTTMWDMAVDPVSNRIYVVGEGKLNTIDGNTNALLHAPLTIANNGKAIAINSVTRRAYIAGEGSGGGNVLVMDITASPPTLVQTVIYGFNPGDVTVNVGANLIYVSGQSSSGGRVVRINGTTNAFAGAPYTVGTDPFGLGYNPTNNTLYVANHASNTVSAIDIATGNVSTVGTGFNNPRHMAVDPTGNRVFVTNYYNKLSVINGATNGVSHISYAQYLDRITFNAASGKLYITEYGGYSDNEILIANGTTGALQSTIPRGRITLLEANPTTNRIYAADWQRLSMLVLDGATGAFTGGTWGFDYPCGVAVNPATNRVYITNRYDNNYVTLDGNSHTFIGTPQNPGVGEDTCIVATDTAKNRILMAVDNNKFKIINGATGVVSSTVTLDQYGLAAIEVNPVTNTIYTLNNSSYTVSAIEGTDLFVLNNINIGGSAESIAVNTASNLVYVQFDNKITVIDGSSNTILTTITGIGSGFSHLAINPSTNRVYVTRFTYNGELVVINGATNTVLTTITGLYYPGYVAVNTSTNRVYVLNNDQKLAVINGTTNEIDGERFVVGGDPARMAVNPNTGRIYITNYYQRSVTVVEDAAVPDAPVQIGPDGVILGTLTPPYSWYAVGGATSYVLRVVDLNTSAEVFSTVYSASICSAGTCQVTPSTALGNNGIYGWYAAAYNGTWGPWSVGKAFLVSVPPTAAPTLIQPDGLFAASDLTPAYRWTPVTGAVMYAMAVYNLNTGTLQFFQAFNASAVCTASECTAEPTGTGTTLTSGGTYGWFMIALSYAGAGPWSAGKAFIIFTPPTAPTLISPSGSVTNPVTFSWNPVTGATQYFVDVLNAGGTRVVGQWVNAASACTASQCQFTPSGSLANGGYAWFVLASNPAGSSGYSPGLGFTVTSGAAPEPAPTFAP